MVVKSSELIHELLKNVKDLGKYPKNKEEVLFEDLVFMRQLTD